MSYTVKKIMFTADEGYVFRNKESGTTYKKLRLSKSDEIENYELVPESELEQEAETAANDNEVVTNEEALTTDQAVVGSTPA